MTNKPFDVVLADPPWKFEFWNEDTAELRGAVLHYPVMELDALKRLDIESLVARDAALFMWGIWSHLPQVLELIGAWGFEYRTLAFVWIKAKPSGFGFYQGMGYYTRRNTEPCLLGVRGSMPVQAHDVSELIYAPVREHSRKPDQQYEKIDRLYPEARKLELFARRKQPGWSTWGNEVEKDVDVGQR